MTFAPAAADVVRAFHRFLDAVAARDLDAVVACFNFGGRVRQRPARAGSRTPSLHLDAGADPRALVRRAAGHRVRGSHRRRGPGRTGIDRFVIDGRELAARCCGLHVFGRPSGLILELRGYVDIDPWRVQLDEVLGSESATS